MTVPGVVFFVVCLTRHPQRMARVEDMRRTIPDLRVIDAVDGRDLTPAQLRAMVDSGFLRRNEHTQRFTDEYVAGRPLTVGNVAAFRSHRAAIEAIADLPAGTCGVVLEDDIELLDPFVRTVTSVAAAVKSGALDADVVHLYVWASQRPVIPPGGDELVLMHTPQGLWGMQAYLVPSARAPRVAAGLWPMRGAIDEQLTRVGLRGVAVLRPSILREDDAIASHTGTLTARTVEHEITLP